MGLATTGRIAVRPLSPILNEKPFLPAVKSGSTEVSLQTNSLTLTHSSPLSTSPNIVVMDWHNGAFRWRQTKARRHEGVATSRTEQLEEGTPSEWLRGFVADRPRPTVPVGLKTGNKRRQAKADRDLINKSLVIVKPPDDISIAFDALVKAGLALKKSALGVTHTSEVFLDDYTGRKGFGGANKLVSDASVEIQTAIPRHVEANFSPLCISVDTRNLFFLPHILVVQNGNDVSARSYDAVHLHVSEWNMQVQHVPAGSEFVGYVWKFMNKGGGPDRRFNNNFQIPVIRTWEVDFAIDSIGELHLAFSSRSAVHDFAAAFLKLQSF